MQSNLGDHNKIMDHFKPYKFTDVEGHPLMNCVEFHKLIDGYCQSESLQKQLAEKDAMIDWLVFRLQSYCNNPLIINCSECRKNDCHNNNWRKAAQEAVKKK